MIFDRKWIENIECQVKPGSVFGCHDSLPVRARGWPVMCVCAGARVLRWVGLADGSKDVELKQETW